MRRAVSAIAVFVLVLVAAAAHAKPVRVAFLYSDGNMSGTLKAYKALLAERPDLRGQITISFVTESVFDTVTPADLTGADVLVLDIMNQQMLDRFNAAHKIDVIAAVSRRGAVFAVGEGLLPKETYIKQGCLWDDRARAYWEHSGFANQIALLKYVIAHAGVAGLTIPDPQRSLDAGYYYPTSRPITPAIPSCSTR
jgi:cobaltochelatase CobN